MMKTSTFLKASAAAIALLLAFGAPAHANIVVNGGFETGNFAGWSSGGVFFVTTSSGGVTPYEGSYFASNGCTSTACATDPQYLLSQTLATTPGATYDLSFAFNPGGGSSATNTDLSVYWNGTLVDTLVGNGLPPAWTVYTVNDLPAPTGSTTLAFGGYQFPAWLGLDAVDVERSQATVPEPASIALLGSALVGFGLIRRRRRKA